MIISAVTSVFLSLLQARETAGSRMKRLVDRWIEWGSFALTFEK